MSQPIFFDGFDDLVRLLVRAPLLYVAVVLFIRVSGKRSLSQMNNFDWIVTVALGSIVASGTLLKDVTLAETLAAIASFLGLQWALTRLTSRSEAAARVIKAEPTLLVRNGEFLKGAMHRERISRDELLAAVRQHGLSSLEDVEWAILETNAKISIVPRSRAGGTPTALTNVGYAARPGAAAATATS